MKRGYRRVGAFEIVLVALLAGVTSNPIWSQDLAQHSVRELPQDFELVELFPGVDETAQRGDSRHYRQLNFVAWEQQFQLELQPSRLFIPGAQVVWAAEGQAPYYEDAESGFWTGHLAGAPDSRVRVKETARGWEGAILSESGEMIFLEPAERFIAVGSRPETMVYRADAASLWDEFACAAGGFTRDQIRAGLKEDQGSLTYSLAMVGDAPNVSFAKGHSFREVELRLVVDSFYSGRHGASSASRVHSLIDQVNLIFEKEMGVTLRIAETFVSMSRGTDGVSASTDSDRLLREFSSSRPLAGSDLAHLFTARELDGETLGAAYIGAACNVDYGSGLTQDQSNGRARMVATAHEIAHGLGARHDGRGYCGRTAQGFIMWPILDPNASAFSQCSEDLVHASLPRFTCIANAAPDALPAPSVLYPTVVSARPVLLRWSSVEGANNYVVEIYSEDFGEVVHQETVNETSLMPDYGFQPGHRYRWRVSGQSDGVVGEKTAWESFSITAWRNGR